MPLQPPPAVNDQLTQSIVLLDDEKSYTELISQLINEALNCPVHGFTNPLEALKRLPELRPAVVVTDFSMPHVNGIEFIRQASLLLPGTAFVMITGNDLSAQKEQLSRLTSLKGFLTKPFTWRVLTAEVLRVWPEGVPAPKAPA